MCGLLSLRENDDDDDDDDDDDVNKVKTDITSTNNDTKNARIS